MGGYALSVTHQQHQSTEGLMVISFYRRQDAYTYPAAQSTVSLHWRHGRK